MELVQGNMNNRIIIALAKYFGKLAKPLDVPVGEAPLDATVTIHLQGMMRRLDDYERAPTTSIPLIPTLALLLQRMGIQREAAKVLIFETMREALLDESTLSEKYTAFAAITKDVQSAIDDVKEITSNLPKETVKGNLTFNPIVVEYEHPQPVAA